VAPFPATVDEPIIEIFFFCAERFVQIDAQRIIMTRCLYISQCLRE